MFLQQQDRPIGLGRQRAAGLTAATLLFSVQSVTRKSALAKHCEMDPYKFIKAKLFCSKKERVKAKIQKDFLQAEFTIISSFLLLQKDREVLQKSLPI